MNKKNNFLNDHTIVNTNKKKKIVNNIWIVCVSVYAIITVLMGRRNHTCNKCDVCAD